MTDREALVERMAEAIMVENESVAWGANYREMARAALAVVEAEQGAGNQRLLRYLRHLPTCAAETAPYGGPLETCNCGLAEAFVGGPEIEAERERYRVLVEAARVFLDSMTHDYNGNEEEALRAALEALDEAYAAPEVKP